MVCRSSGGSDCIEQDALDTRLTTVAQTDPMLFTAFLPASLSQGVPTLVGLERPGGAALSSDVVCGFAEGVCDDDMACTLASADGALPDAAFDASGVGLVVATGEAVPTREYTVHLAPSSDVVLCCRAHQGTDCVRQMDPADSSEPLRLTVVAATPANLFTSAAPSPITRNIATVITLTGSANHKSDACVFTLDVCEANHGAVCASSGVAVLSTAFNPATTHTVNIDPAIGASIHLCCRSYLGSDCVMQASESGTPTAVIATTAATSNSVFGAITPSSMTRAVDTAVTLSGAFTGATDPLLGGVCGFAEQGNSGFAGCGDGAEAQREAVACGTAPCAGDDADCYSVGVSLSGGVNPGATFVVNMPDSAPLSDGDDAVLPGGGRRRLSAAGRGDALGGPREPRRLGGRLLPALDLARAPDPDHAGSRARGRRGQRRCGCVLARVGTRTLANAQHRSRVGTGAGTRRRRHTRVHTLAASPFVIRNRPFLCHLRRFGSSMHAP